MPTKERVKKDKLLDALENGGEAVKRMFTVSNDLSANIGIAESGELQLYGTTKEAIQNGCLGSHGPIWVVARNGE